MTEADMNAKLKEWVEQTNVPLGFTGNLNDVRQGAVEFARWIMDKVELVAADEPPKE